MRSRAIFFSLFLSLSVEEEDTASICFVPRGAADRVPKRASEDPISKLKEGKCGLSFSSLEEG